MAGVTTEAWRTDPMTAPPRSAVVVTNPDEDCSPAAFHALLDDLLAGPEPELESLGAAEALRGVARRRRGLTAVVIDASAGAAIGP